MTNNCKLSKILIVDDARLNIKLLENILTENGYRVTAAKNASNALKLMQSTTPDLILLDIMMPDIDGISLCRQLKKLEMTKKIPVIFITALSDTADKLEAFRAGGVDYITKPFVMEEVIARINVHICLKKAVEKLEKMLITDEMTGVFNRRFAYEILAKQIYMVKREQSSFVVCYIDIDNLKTINDNFGHAEGDRLIKTVVNSLKSVIRYSDYICRMGGDEFLLIFPKAKIKDTDNMVERIRKHLNNETINEIPIDFSFGFSEFHAGSDLSAEDLIKIADSCMFKTKARKKS